jgi:hypothetical protein
MNADTVLIKTAYLILLPLCGKVKKFGARMEIFNLIIFNYLSTHARMIAGVTAIKFRYLTGKQSVVGDLQI